MSPGLRSIVLSSIIIVLLAPLGAQEKPATAPAPRPLQKFAEELLDGRGVSGRLAVIAFSVEGGDPRLGRVLAFHLRRELERQTKVPLVNRAKIKQVMGDHMLDPVGIVSLRDLKLIGSLLGAKQLIVGEVTCAGRRGLVKGFVVHTGNGQVLTRARTRAKCR